MACDDRHRSDRAEQSGADGRLQAQRLSWRRAMPMMATRDAESVLQGRSCERSRAPRATTVTPSTDSLEQTPEGGDTMMVRQTAANDGSRVPAHARRKSRWRAVSVVVRLFVLASLLLACTPTAPPAPTSAPAKPAEAAKPTAAPAAPAAPAKPAEAPKPAEAAKPAAAPAAAAKVEPKGSMTIALNEEPPMLAAHDATATFSYPVMRNVTEALLNRDPATNQLVGELATKWEQTNPTTWRFTLRQGVKFHDGSPWNAEAAADAMNEMLNKENNYRVRTFLGPEIEAKSAGEYMLDLVTAAPDPILPSRVYFMPFHSPTARKARPEEVPTKPIGTGPYKLVEWVKG